MQSPFQPQPSKIYTSQGQFPNQQMAMNPPSTNATLALVFSIIGIIGASFYGLGLFFAIPGLILANGALRITNQFPNHPDAGIAKAAQICGWVGLGISLALVLLVVLVGVLYVWADSLA